MRILIVASDDSLKNLKNRKGVEILPLTSICFSQLVKEFKIDFEFDWVLFTSKQGVKSFSEACGIEILKNKKIAAIGKKTADCLRELSINADFIPSQYSSEQFVNEFPKKATVEKGVFYPTSKLANDFIESKFKNENIHIIRKNFYTTVCVDNLEIPEFDCIVFSSPSSANCFLNLYDIKGLKNKKVISIGPKTMKFLKQLNIESEIPEKFTLTNAIDLCCKK